MKRQRFRGGDQSAADIEPESLSEEDVSVEMFESGTGTEEDPIVFTVSNAQEITDAVAEINENTDNSMYYTISMLNDISFTGMQLKYNTTTILGNGHTLSLTEEAHITVTGGDQTSNPVLILGKEDDKTNTLTLQGETVNDVPSGFVVGSASDGITCGTLKMYDGVTITGAVSNNYYGGGVIVGSGGYFEMNGGTIEKCGIDGGAVCFGGGVAVINKGKFTMNGGSIQKCFLKTGYCETQNLSWNLSLNYGAGAGVFVSNGAVFKMTGGEIKDNYIEAKNETVWKSYGVGGGIAVTGSARNYDITAHVEITGGIIQGNHATLGGGGIAVCGMRAVSPAVATVYNPDGSSDNTPGLVINGTENDPVQIINNTADGWSEWAVGGGGILLYRLKDTYDLKINNAVISGNTVTAGPGGGIESANHWSFYSVVYSVENTVLSGNQATEGGAVCLYNSTDSSIMKAEFTNTTIKENTAADKGGGISVENRDVNAAENTVVTFHDGCAIYSNSATDVCSDDFYKYSNSTVYHLPTAEQISENSGLSFTGWYKDEKDNRYSENNAEEYTPVDSTTDQLQLKIVKVEVQRYIVTFDTKGGSKIEAQTVEAGGTVGKPDNPLYKGYKFAGWFTDENYQNAYNFDTPVTSDMTLYAKWVKKGSSHRTYPDEDNNNSGNGTSGTAAVVSVAPTQLSQVPKTGDNANMMLWITLAGLSAAGLLTAVSLRRRRKIM